MAANQSGRKLSEATCTCRTVTPPSNVNLPHLTATTQWHISPFTCHWYKWLAAQPQPTVYSPAIRGLVDGTISTFCMQQYTARPVKRLKKVHFLPNDDPINTSPCVTQVWHGSAWKILPTYVMPFQSLSQTDTNTTLKYLVDKKSSVHNKMCSI